MKRILAILLAGLMLLSLAACGGKDKTSWKFGIVSSANNYINYYNHLSEAHSEGKVDAEFVLYDNLNAALMALNKKDITALYVDKASGDYITAHNADFVFVEEALYPASNDYSMMTLENNKEVYDILNNAINDMKADGTLDTLIENELKAYIESDPVAKELPHFDGAKTIKIGVTGDLPPMDFVASNGKAAGFNIALIAEIANRAQVNIELIQIESGARAISLSSGKVDAVFWAKSATCDICNATGMENIEGAIITHSYFTDFVATIALKPDK
jgi:ABC-type amino acid transport substrate-binding protein